MTQAKAPTDGLGKNRPMRLGWFLAWFALPALAAQPLQALIDAAPPGGTLRLAPGSYAGPAVVDRPLTIEGGGRAVVEGGGQGTVITVKAGGTTLRGLVVARSGDSHDQIHSAIQVESDDNRIEDNRIEDALFGIHIRAGNRNRVRGNRVTGKNLPLGQRGDGLRLWNGRGNVIEANTFDRIRDLTFANSPDNTIRGNRLRDGRYGMHFVFSPRSLVADNLVEHTGTGIVVLYSPGLTVRGNRIRHALDGGGAGLAFKESGEAIVEGNEIVHCAVGLQANAPLNDAATITISRNRFAHNIVGMYFYGEKGGHRIEDNRFENNLTQVAVSGVGTGEANSWRANFWSDYQGFDRNRDGRGDTPHEAWVYADRIWMETPKATFFRNSPALELLDFLERLAPFASPSLLLRDDAPRMR